MVLSYKNSLEVLVASLHYFRQVPHSLIGLQFLLPQNNGKILALDYLIEIQWGTNDKDRSTRRHTYLLTGIWSIMEQEKVYVELIEKYYLGI